MLQDRGARCEERVCWAADSAAGAVPLPAGKRRRARPIHQQPLAWLLLTKRHLPPFQSHVCSPFHKF